MCFSASASFGVSAVLLVAGVVALKKVKEKSKKPFALIPIIFSIQQFSEGLHWLSYTNESYVHWHEFSMYFFLVVAQIVWPFWVPMSVWSMENNPKRRKILSFLLILGILDSLFLAFCLFYFKVESSIDELHINYTLNSREAILKYSSVIYLTVTIIPLLISSVPRVFILGLIIAASAALSRFYFHDFFISVWCFFAAIISLIILYILSYQKREKKF